MVAEGPGWGILAAVKLAEDVAARQFFEAGGKARPSVVAAMHNRGVIASAFTQADILAVAQPLCLTNDEADVIVAATVEAVHEVLGRS